MLTKLTKISIALALSVAAGLAAHGALRSRRRSRSAPAGTGGVYYPLGGGIANVLSKYLPDVQATAASPAARSTISS